MIEVPSGCDEGMPKIIFIEETMKIGTEDACVGSHAAIEMRGLFRIRLANQLGKGFCILEVERFSDVNLITLETDLRDWLVEE